MEPEKKSNGALIGSVIIILILLVGGIYVWMSRAKTEPLPAENLGTEEAADLNTLEQDIDSVDMNIEANVIDSVE